MTVTLDEFKATLKGATLPAVGPLLRALWHAARGDWDEAHKIAQDVADETAAWVHAYLHRKEGDFSNACYWYRRARKQPATDSFEEEWERIVKTLLEA